MAEYQGKHRRESQWAALTGRVRDTVAQIAESHDAEEPYEGIHRDDSHAALHLDLARGGFQ